MTTDAKTQEDVLKTTLQDFIVRATKEEVTAREVSTVVAVLQMLYNIRNMNTIVDRAIMIIEKRVIEELNAVKVKQERVRDDIQRQEMDNVIKFPLEYVDGEV